MTVNFIHKAGAKTINFPAFFYDIKTSHLHVMVTKQGIYRKYLEDAKYTKRIHQSVNEAVSLHLGLHAALMYTFCIHQCRLKTLKHTLCIHHCCLKALMYTLCIHHCCFKVVMYTHSIHQ